jgi:hypothetical protein
MGRFMVAHLSNGGVLLKPETARLMHSLSHTTVPGMNGMALGFYQNDWAGQHVIGHGGDTVAFHSDLSLLPEHNIGIYVSFNSRGKDGVVGPLRHALLRDFIDRYYPSPLPNEPAVATAAEHGAALAGSWTMSRAGVHSWFRLAAMMSPVKIALNADNTLTIAMLTDIAGTPKRWREVKPWVWREVNGRSQLAAKIENGKPVALTTDWEAPVFEFLPAGFAVGAGAMPLVGAAAAVLLLTLVLWPVAALVRWHYARPLRLVGRERTLYRLSRITALVQLLFIGGFFYLLTQAGSNLGLFSAGLDPVLRLLQLVGVIGILGTVLVLYRAVRIVQDGSFGWWGKVSNVVLALACLVFVWAGFAYNLFSPGLQY